MNGEKGKVLTPKKMESRWLIIMKSIVGDGSGKNNVTFSVSCQMHVQANTTVC